MKKLLFLLCLFLPFGILWSQQATREAAFRSMVATDEAFDELSAAQGMDAAFLAYLADSAVVFRPGPVPANEWIRAHPTRRAFVLRWSPLYGEVSRSGDLGYTIGSYESRYGTGDTARVGHGYYLTVWETDRGGAWKAIVDGGVSVRENLTVRRGVVENRTPMGGGQGSLGGLMQFDRASGASLAVRPLRETMDSLLAMDAMLLRDVKGLGPGTASPARFLGIPDAQLKTRPLGGGLSSSGDLGFTYGTYAISVGGAPAREGYYVRVWRCGSAGGWRVAVDLAMPGPLVGN